MAVSPDVIVSQVVQLSNRFPEVSYDPDSQTVLMPFRLDATFNDCWLVEDFTLRIVLHDGYPHTLPSIYEESDRISDEFEHRYVDGSLCYGIPGEILMNYPGGIDLVRLIEGPVTCCLYSAVFLQRFGSYPFGERSHGIAGILEYYRELFGVDSDQAALRLMSFVAEEKSYKGSDKCPCGSGRQIWTCHGKALAKLGNEECVTAIKDDYKRAEAEIRRHKNRVWLSNTVRANTRYMLRTRA